MISVIPRVPVIRKSCSKALRRSIWSKSHRNWSNPYSPHVIFDCSWYQWRHCYHATALVCQTVRFVSNCKNNTFSLHFLRQSVKICSKLARHKFYLVYMYTTTRMPFIPKSQIFMIVSLQASDGRGGKLRWNAVSIKQMGYSWQCTDRWN